VLTFVARGLTDGEIAERLVRSEATIKTHVDHILTTLRLRDRLGAVIAAYRS
jgi:DNA-binding NarL/FixJ family response regulator